MHPKDAAIVLVTMSALLTAAWAMYLFTDASKRHRRMKAQAELHARLLDKFSSAAEVVDFLQTPGGLQFVDSISSDRDEPAAGILRSTHRGIVLIVVAIGVLSLIRAYGWENNPLLVVGVILLCMGVGFVLSAVVSQQLSRKLGLAGRNGGARS